MLTTLEMTEKSLLVVTFHLHSLKQKTRNKNIHIISSYSISRIKDIIDQVSSFQTYSGGEHTNKYKVTILEGAGNSNRHY